jgi:VIT1/CCC1 family predicted Fe2+/Mn2+ transporter
MRAVGRKKRHISWLPAAVLGADDGIVSTASIVLGVAMAQGSHASIVIAGATALVAGAMSMAASEYVSVHALSDYEQADLLSRRLRRKTNAAEAHAALSASYVSLGLNAVLAGEVADGLMANGALGAIARDKLLIPPARRARPSQAALVSAGSFAVGSVLPVAIAAMLPPSILVVCLPLASLFFLAVLGGLAAKAGGARVWTGSLRVMFWGALAMAITAGVGMVFGAYR